MSNNPVSFFSHRVLSSAGARRLALICAVAVCLLGSASPEVAMSGNVSKASVASARAGHPAIGPWDDGRVALGGNTLSDLTAQFWQWNYSIPLGVDPFTDTSGANCGINQVGNVWFLGGPTGIFTTSCTIPAGKLIVSPVFAAVDDFPCPDPAFTPAPGQSLEDFLLQDIGPYIDQVGWAAAELDGGPLKVRRIKSHLFPFTAAASRVPFDSCITGSPQLGVSDGYFVFIEPLSRGDHLLVLRSEGSNIGTIDLKIR